MVELVVTALKRRRSARWGESALFRKNSDPALRSFEQHLRLLGTLWINDFVEPGLAASALIDRWNRILPKLRKLSGSGPRVEAPAMPFYLLVHDKAYKALEGLPRLPRRPRNRSADLPTSRRRVAVASAQRKKFLQLLFHDLPLPSPKNANAIFHESTGELWFPTGKTSKDDLVEKWAQMSRHEVACDVAAHVLARSLGASADYVHQLLPRLRKEASRIDQALAGQN